MKPHTYRTSPVFILTEDDWKSYRNVVMQAIKTERMALMSNGNTLEWIDTKLKSFKPKKEENKEKV